ncbi:hypothetical protein GWK47_033669 [Chionoecetes opilio]|uniref:Uncharacterized protein n=1 Tax=Chionoecetes opilio TaxID=41210 RepID=A0A8J5D083_CHIOP|nr:hypothetical protein GWK47_033669 [Chionoecetes opilio]
METEEDKGDREGLADIRVSTPSRRTTATTLGASNCQYRLTKGSQGGGVDLRGHPVFCDVRILSQAHAATWCSLRLTCSDSRKNRYDACGFPRPLDDGFDRWSLVGLEPGTFCYQVHVDRIKEGRKRPIRILTRDNELTTPRR